MDDEIGNFAVIFRPPQPTRPMYKIEVNTSQYTFAAAAASLAIKALQTPTAKQSMFDMAEQIAESVAMRAPIMHDEGLRRQAVDLFVAKISHKFPGIVIDSTIDDVRLLGFHIGRPWFGSLEQYDSRAQMVHINAQRLEDLMAAAELKTPTGERQFKTFIFQLATTFVHEVGGHVLMTFLSQAVMGQDGQYERPFTPPDVTYANYGSEDAGEAGRVLEELLYGGAMEYYREPNSGPRQPGIPHLLDGDNKVRRISQEAIMKGISGSGGSF